MSRWILSGGPSVFTASVVRIDSSHKPPKVVAEAPLPRAMFPAASAATSRMAIGSPSTAKVGTVRGRSPSMGDREPQTIPPPWVRSEGSQEGAARAEEVPVEPAQGANLAVQIEEWRMVMIKEQQEYEERRKE